MVPYPRCSVEGCRIVYREMKSGKAGEVFYAEDGTSSEVLVEKYDPTYEPTLKELEECAKFFGIDVINESHLMWICRDALKAPLPPGWKPCQVEGGQIYYFNFDTGESVWEHPMDAYFKAKLASERLKAGQGAAEGSGGAKVQQKAQALAQDASRPVRSVLNHPQVADVVLSFLDSPLLDAVAMSTQSMNQEVERYVADTVVEAMHVMYATPLRPSANAGHRWNFVLPAAVRLVDLLPQLAFMSAPRRQSIMTRLIALNSTVFGQSLGSNSFKVFFLPNDNRFVTPFEEHIQLSSNAFLCLPNYHAIPFMARQPSSKLELVYPVDNFSTPRHQLTSAVDELKITVSQPILSFPKGLIHRSNVLDLSGITDVEIISDASLCASDAAAVDGVGVHTTEVRLFSFAKVTKVGADFLANHAFLRKVVPHSEDVRSSYQHQQGVGVATPKVVGRNFMAKLGRLSRLDICFLHGTVSVGDHFLAESGSNCPGFTSFTTCNRPFEKLWLMPRTIPSILPAGRIFFAFYSTSFPRAKWRSNVLPIFSRRKGHILT